MTQNANEKLDCLARVITPENIEFEYSLAGPFQRLPAFLFDLAVRALAFIAVLFLMGILFSFAPFGGAVFTIVALLMFFAFSWFYGIFFESRFNGRTLGKMVFKLRVISVDGRPINATQAALRNLLRLADMCILLPLQVFDAEAPAAFLIPTLLVGLVVMIISPRMQRVGDLAAGTMVVSEYGQRSPWNLQPEDRRAFGLEEMIPATFQASGSLAQTVGLYMENRRRLSILRRQEVAKHLALPLIHEFSLLPDTSYDLLLCALYVRIFMSGEQREQGRARLREAPRSVAAAATTPSTGIPSLSMPNMAIPAVSIPRVAIPEAPISGWTNAADDGAAVEKVAEQNAEEFRAKKREESL